jgi:hypothetical protein
MAKQPPSVSPKAPMTGKGQVFQTPSSGAQGPSKHLPVTGK